MKGTPPLSEREVEPVPGYQWIAGLGASLRAAKGLKHAFKGGPLEIRAAPSGLWLILTLSRSVRLGILAAANLSGAFKAEVRAPGPDRLSLRAEGGFGRYDIGLTRDAKHPSLLRLTVSLTPGGALKVKSLPRDLCILDARLDPLLKPGRVLTSQTENAAAQAYLATKEDGGAAVLYFQNLTSLADYFRKTEAKIKNAVSVEWPSAGFALPAGEGALERGKSVVLSDAFIATAPAPGTDKDAALQFLEFLGRVYPHLTQPETGFTDWPKYAQTSLRSLVSCKECCPVVNGSRFFQAYVGSCAKPPESMVQAAIMVPMMEYEEHRRRKVPLLKELQHVPEAFYHPRLKALLRWLPGCPFDKEERSEEEHRFRMDSWYLLHTMLNYSRLAEMGLPSARAAFFKALPNVMAAAQHFSHDWPVFYDQRNRRIFKAETKAGEGGEQDAPALYVKLMLAAYSLTHKPEYLKEAEVAANKLHGLAFGTLYQTNNTVMGAIGLARLWRLTGKTEYRDLSIVNIASAFSHLWLWNLGAPCMTFMGLPPLHDAPYIALYEEAEIIASLPVWQKDMGEDMPYGARLLVAEYQKHLLSRAKYYYPAELDPDIIENPAKEGPIIRNLRMPLEGLGPPREKAGTVGQAIYAAAAPFILTTRAWHHPAHAPFTVFCEYPLLECHAGGTKKEGTATLRVAGVPELRCKMRVAPISKRLSIECRANGKKLRLMDTGKALTAKMPGDSTIELSWKKKK